jgi:uncharacterized BrkB/YihY/UPF0761 family membrane protein
MVDSLFKIFLFRRIRVLWILSLITNIITLLLALHQGNGARSVVLHYNVVVGAELFGSTSELLKLPLAGFFILIVNIVIYRVLKNRSQVLAEAAAWVSFLTSALLLTALLFLIRIN